MKSIASSVKDLLCKNIFKHNRNLAEIIFHWKEMLSDDISQYTYPRNIYKSNNRSILVIGVLNSYISTEIYYQGSIIIQQINDFFGYELIDGIKIK